jgi:hypothetical protein
MRKIITIGLCMVAVFLLSGAGYRFYLSQYEEVCTQFQMNVTAIPQCLRYFDFMDCRNGENATLIFNQTLYRNEYTPTDKCVEYQLRRRTNVTPFIYSFNWCEVYPESKECAKELSPCACCGDLCQGLDCDWNKRYQINSSHCNV